MAQQAGGFLAGLLVVSLLAAAPVAAATFSNPMTLSNGGPAITPAMAVTSTGQVYVVWKEGNDILFTRSRPTEGSCNGPGGLEFETPVALSAATGIASVPAVAANGNGGVFVAWQGNPDWPAAPGVYFRRSVDHGRTFMATAKLSEDTSSATFPSVAADNAGGVFVAWQDDNFAAFTSSVKVAQSTDGGETFASPRANVFTADGFGFFQPAVVSDGSKVHVVWNDVALLGVWYKAFARDSDASTVEGIQLTTAVALYPKVAVHGNQVMAAWIELVGAKVKARTMTGGQPFEPEAQIYSSANVVLGLSLTFGDAGRLFGWQEADFSASTSSIRYVLGSGTAQTLRSGSLEANLAAPSVGQHGTDRLLASWQENSSDMTPQINLAHTGGSAGGPSMLANVWAEPKVLNYRTVGLGTGQQPNFTVYIELPGDAASTIDLGSVKLKIEGKEGEYSPLAHPTALGDHNGNGTLDLMVKFNRRIFEEAALATATQRNGSYTLDYTVTGTTSGGCFSSAIAVQIVR